MKTTYIFILFLCFAGFVKSQSITWNGTGADLSMSMYGNMHPRACTDRSGNPLVVWGRMSDESVMFSRWNGSAFTTPVKLNPDTMTVAGASWMGPNIASHGDTVYVVVKRSPEVEITNYIYLIRSFDGGQNFDAPIRVDMIGDSIARFPTVTTDESGNPIVAFMKFNSSFMDSRWVVARSSDFGSTFSIDVKASGWGSSDEVCDCCPGAVVSDGNTTAMLYRDNNNNIRDIWAGISTDNTASFTAGCNIDNHNWMLMQCPSSGPDGIIIGDTLHSVFMNGAGGDNLVYYSKSSLNNASVGTVSNITNSIPGLTSQNYPRIDRNGLAVGIVWTQVVNSVVQLPILFTENIQNGLPAVYDTVDLGNITNTDVVIGNGNIFVFWQDAISGTVKFRRGTFGSSASVPGFESASLLTVNPNPAKDKITVQYPAGARNLKVTDALGKEVLLHVPQLSETEYVLNIASWKKGIYLLSIQSGKTVYTHKVIKE